MDRKESTMWKVKEHNKEKEELLIKNGAGKLLSRLLSQRNIDVEQCHEFINADYEKISHPHSLHDNKKAVEVFCKHALNESSVGITGDYDADGLLSSSMVYELCRTFKMKCQCFIPSRFKHGYG